jgi:hypothetical protein
MLVWENEIFDFSRKDAKTQGRYRVPLASSQLGEKNVFVNDDEQIDAVVIQYRPGFILTPIPETSNKSLFA